MVFELSIVKIIFDKIVSGENISGEDVNSLVFDKNFKLPEGFLTSEDFKQILDAFNFNADNDVNIEDFKYLKDHIQDLSMIIKLVKIVALVISKFCKIKNIKLTTDDMMDTISRIIAYCVLFIVVTNCEEFRKWASENSSGTKTNSDNLFEILTEIIGYIKSTNEIKNIVKNAFNFFKNKFASCFSSLKNEDKIQQANVQIKSLKSQLNKDYKLHQISKMISKINY